DHAIDAASVNCFPNPANEKTNLSFTLTAASEVTIEVFDALGNRVESISNNGQLAAGTHTQVISTENYAAGMYFVTVTTGETVITRRMSVVH
ncbi:MAG TPA: T9SS type A sorting domain-containing protein, partial [Bacteroidia bacterium]|nr:T9SS type A sorting domain-containing protein [Bacteroidia bacterium]